MPFEKIFTGSLIECLFYGCCKIFQEKPQIREKIIKINIYPKTILTKAKIGLYTNGNKIFSGDRYLYIDKNKEEEYYLLAIKVDGLYKTLFTEISLLDLPAEINMEIAKYEKEEVLEQTSSYFNHLTKGKFYNLSDVVEYFPCEYLTVDALGKINKDVKNLRMKIIKDVSDINSENVMIDVKNFQKEYISKNIKKLIIIEYNFSDFSEFKNLQELILINSKLKINSKIKIPEKVKNLRIEIDSNLNEIFNELSKSNIEKLYILFTGHSLNHETIDVSKIKKLKHFISDNQYKNFKFNLGTIEIFECSKISYKIDFPNSLKSLTVGESYDVIDLSKMNNLEYLNISSNIYFKAPPSLKILKIDTYHPYENTIENLENFYIRKIDDFDGNILKTEFNKFKTVKRSNFIFDDFIFPNLEQIDVFSNYDYEYKENEDKIDMRKYKKLKIINIYDNQELDLSENYIFNDYVKIINHKKNIDEQFFEIEDFNYWSLIN